MRTDKQSHLDELASAAEKAAADNKQGALYRITNNISGRGYRTDTFEDRQEQTELETRWAAENLKEALNKEPVDTQGAPADLEINTNLQSKQEFISAIKALKNGKAPGLDKLDAGLFKADHNLAAEILLPLFTEILEQEKIPLD